MASSAEPSTVYDFEAVDIDGNNVSMDKYKGRVLIVVNLVEMHNRLADRGLAIAAFPCNQFGSQEPWPEAEIKAYIARWNVAFDMYSKINVNGSATHPLFVFLKNRLSGTFGDFIKWNFTKFLVDSKGVPVKRFSPTTAPKDMEADVVKLLDEIGK
uniref:Glutathione peroxidase n=2 Tax=Macrostomum lignano TaxID=282301 RepID=A0A1I8I0I2_9PLAT